MSQRRFVKRFCSALVALAVLAITGCGQPNPPATVAGAGDHDEAGHSHREGDSHGKSEAGTDDHSGWWCAEHGVPEGECSQCNSKIAADFQTKGDWCQEHDRAKSQCFVCDPKAQEKYAAIYKAKYGENPPRMASESPSPDVAKPKD